jgi:hypothetical protein
MPKSRLPRCAIHEGNGQTDISSHHSALEEALTVGHQFFEGYRFVTFAALGLGLEQPCIDNPKLPPAVVNGAQRKQVAACVADRRLSHAENLGKCILRYVEAFPPHPIMRMVQPGGNSLVRGMNRSANRTLSRPVEDARYAPLDGRLDAGKPFRRLDKISYRQP